MKLYYLASHQTILDNRDLLHEWHAIPAEDRNWDCKITPVYPGQMLICVKFLDEAAELIWSKVPGVEPLPHPLSNQPVSDVHVAKLTSLGVAKGHRTFDVAEAAGKIHPLLRLTVF